MDVLSGHYIEDLKPGMSAVYTKTVLGPAASGGVPVSASGPVPPSPERRIRCTPVAPKWQPLRVR